MLIIIMLLYYMQCPKSSQIFSKNTISYEGGQKRWPSTIWEVTKIVLFVKSINPLYRFFFHISVSPKYAFTSLWAIQYCQSFLNFQFWKLRRRDWLLWHSRLWAFTASVNGYYFSYYGFLLKNLISHFYCCFRCGKSFLSVFVCISCFTWRIRGIGSTHCHIWEVRAAATWRLC